VPSNENLASDFLNRRFLALSTCWAPTQCVKFAGIVNLLGPYTVCQSYGMNTPPATTKYKNHRFPVEIISHAVWLYFRFCLSFRDVEEILLERGVVVTSRRSASGAVSLAKNMPISSVAAVPGQATSGTWMRCF
jgi:hypothetical protein